MSNNKYYNGSNHIFDNDYSDIVNILPASGKTLNIQGLTESGNFTDATFSGITTINDTLNITGTSTFTNTFEGGANGENTQIQYNSNDSFKGATGLTYSDFSTRTNITDVNTTKIGNYIDKNDTLEKALTDGVYLDGIGSISNDYGTQVSTREASGNFWSFIQGIVTNVEITTVRVFKNNVYLTSLAYATSSTQNGLKPSLAVNEDATKIYFTDDSLVSRYTKYYRSGDVFTKINDALNEAYVVSCSGDFLTKSKKTTNSLIIQNMSNNTQQVIYDGSINSPILIHDMTSNTLVFHYGSMIHIFKWSGSLWNLSQNINFPVEPLSLSCKDLILIVGTASITYIYERTTINNDYVFKYSINKGCSHVNTNGTTCFRVNVNTIAYYSKDSEGLWVEYTNYTTSPSYIASVSSSLNRMVVGLPLLVFGKGYTYDIDNVFTFPITKLQLTNGSLYVNSKINNIILESGPGGVLNYYRGIEADGLNALTASFGIGGFSSGILSNGNPYLLTTASAGQNIVNGTFTPTTTLWNNYTYINYPSNIDIGTVPVPAFNTNGYYTREAGFYLVFYSCIFNLNSTGLRWSAIQVNGDEYFGIQTSQGNASFLSYNSGSFVFYCDYNTRLQLVVYQNSGGTLGVVGGTKMGCIKLC